MVVFLEHFQEEVTSHFEVTITTEQLMKKMEQRNILEYTFSVCATG